MPATLPRAVYGLVQDRLLALVSPLAQLDLDLDGEDGLG